MVSPLSPLDILIKQPVLRAVPQQGAVAPARDAHLQVPLRVEPLEVDGIPRGKCHKSDGALGELRVPIYAMSARAVDNGRAAMSITLGISNTEHLNNVLAKLRKVRDVIQVIRI